jgi:hypothetical protein
VNTEGGENTVAQRRAENANDEEGDEYRSDPKFDEQRINAVKYRTLGRSSLRVRCHLIS